MATKVRIIAYSTRPWPFSWGANNMEKFLAKKKHTSEYLLRVNGLRPCPKSIYVP
jgi:hypothetical protein